MQAVRINDVGVGRPVNTKNGARLIFPINVLEMSMNRLYDVDVWANEGEVFEYSAGQEVSMDIKPGQEYKGKQQYSASMSKMALLKHTSEIATEILDGEEVVASAVPVKTPSAPPVASPQTSEKEMWAAKERRDFKGRALMYATQAISQVHREKIWEDEKEFVDMVEMVASQYVDYIYMD